MCDFSGSMGRVVVSSTFDSDRINKGSLLIKDSTGKVAETIPLKVCKGTFVSDQLSFPLGSYTYDITGTDVSGVPFTLENKGSATFEKNENLYKLTGDASPITVRAGHDFKVVYTLSNGGKFCTKFKINVPKIDGFELSVHPNKGEVTVQGESSVKVTITGRATSAAGGSTHKISITASNDCSTLKSEKPVTVRKTNPPKVDYIINY